MAAPWFKRTKRAVRAALICTFVRALMRLPLWLAFPLGAALGRLGWALSPRLRADARASLAVAFPEKTEAEREAIGRESLVNLGKTGGEAISMRSWAPRMDEYV